MPHTARVLCEIERERTRQDAKWGRQDHPDRPNDMNDPMDLAWLLGVPEADEARAICEIESKRGNTTWSHVLSEEFAEAIHEAAVGDQDKLRIELVQVAAVAVAWIECIDRRLAEKEGAPF